MGNRRRVHEDPMGIVNEETTHTNSGLITITNRHIGEAVYEVKIVSEDGRVIERFGEMTRGRAWGVYDEKCRHYGEGINPLSEENPISLDELEDGLPDDVLSGFRY